MATYQLHFQANPTLWPNDPQQLLALWEQAFQACDALIETGAMQAPRFVNTTEGYVLVEADSKSAALAVAAQFFPNWTNEIDELVPWNDAKEAILGALR